MLSPLVFLGGSFYSITMLPPLWQTITLFNPVVYLISGFRWAFFDTADVGVGWSLLAIAGFTCLCLGAHRLDLPHRLSPAILTLGVSRTFVDDA